MSRPAIPRATGSGNPESTTPVDKWSLNYRENAETKAEIRCPQLRPPPAKFPSRPILNRNLHSRRFKGRKIWQAGLLAWI
jgi:hypothetical protein